MEETVLFCKNILRLRRRAKLSKKEMAKVLGIGTKSLNLLESGKIPPRLSCEIFCAIHRQFGILPKDLFTTLL